MEFSRILLQQEQNRIFGGSHDASIYGSRFLEGKNKRNEEEKDANQQEEENTAETPLIEETIKEETAQSHPEETQDNSNIDDSLVGETRIDLVKLVPFDVKLSLISEGAPLNSFALTDIVSGWMEESLAAQVKLMELGLTHSAFDSVILEERGITQQTTPSSSTTTTLTSALLTPGNRRKLQTSSTTATYEGVTLWKHTTNSNLQIMTPSLVEDIERQALLQDERLLELLQLSPAEGLGDQVQEVRAYINPNPSNYVPIQPPNADATNPSTSSTTNANLELIIVVAIVVACMAFAFLVFSLFWAWRFDQQKRDAAYRVDSTAAPPKASPAQNKRSPRSSDAAGVTDDSEDEDPVPSSNSNIVANRNVNQDDEDTTLQYPGSEANPTTGIYPESVISEDISTSLSAYYRSGMGTRPLYGSRTLGTNDFNDQASFSSMESYGYSLDGYAPSLGGNTYSNNGPARPLSEAGDENE